MAAKKPPFASEAEMCGVFIAALDPTWTAYAETAGWDILLVRASDGFQIGVQAKLRLNAAVITQALEDYYDRAGPDCRAVLVPESEGKFHRIAAYIGLTVITVRKPLGQPSHWANRLFSPALPDGTKQWGHDDWYELAPLKRHQLPEYVPDVAAGSSAPLQLTAWKISAIKIAIIIETRGYVTRADFKAIGIDHRRWLPQEQAWLATGEQGFTAGKRMPNFRQQHPIVYEQIAADADKWMPKVLVSVASVRQEAML